MSEEDERTPKDAIIGSQIFATSAIQELLRGIDSLPFALIRLNDEDEEWFPWTHYVAIGAAQKKLQQALDYLESFREEADKTPMSQHARVVVKAFEKSMEEE